MSAKTMNITQKCEALSKVSLTLEQRLFAHLIFTIQEYPKTFTNMSFKEVIEFVKKAGPYTSSEAGRTAKRERGGFIGGHAPAGYRKVGDGKNAILVPNEDELKIMAAAKHYHDVLGWRSPTRIAERLNAEGYTSRRGTPLVATQVWRWLRH